MFTYIIKDGDRDFVKIGKAFDVRRRMKNLQCANPSPLVLLSVHPSNVEAELHQRFKASWHRGEWFVYTDDIKSFVADSHVQTQQLLAGTVTPTVQGTATKLMPAVTRKQAPKKRVLPAFIEYIPVDGYYPPYAFNFTDELLDMSPVTVYLAKLVARQAVASGLDEVFAPHFSVYLNPALGITAETIDADLWETFMFLLFQYRKNIHKGLVRYTPSQNHSLFAKMTLPWQNDPSVSFTIRRETLNLLLEHHPTFLDE
ncbi:hypothetical protein E5K00_16450 [Hymenobacter aquaticus]|uniref:Bacteriophage T5 Orf172 DNA-binding domain-containing protein n=1 Tax=Hymenobacter aquaticus TaxID=1867101 RepID=A0A4Z0PWK9_9BACT|nr:GIY-YIG nuclease family protein [Hymenobacter aquaticus]TGE21855.1 hypothetical protein E5K00_16450 [Hymenobacter aquaticus]